MPQILEISRFCPSKFTVEYSFGNSARDVSALQSRKLHQGRRYKRCGRTNTHLLSTILRTFDNCKVIVPNSRITSDNITNYSAKETRRIDLEFGVSYHDDLKLTRRILEEIVKADERILKDPAPEIGVLELGESSVNFFVRPWVMASDYWPTKCDLLEKVKLTFDDEGISIPFPQRDVHLYQATAV